MVSTPERRWQSDLGWRSHLFFQNFNQVFNHDIERPRQPVDVSEVNGCHPLTLSIISDCAIAYTRTVGNFFERPTFISSKLSNSQPN